jgi:hypothetical protein
MQWVRLTTMLKRHWYQRQFSLGSLVVITEISNPCVDLVDAIRERAEYADERSERIFVTPARAHHGDSVLGKKLDPIAFPQPQVSADVERHRDLAFAGYSRNVSHSLHSLHEVRIPEVGTPVYRLLKVAGL